MMSRSTTIRPASSKMALQPINLLGDLNIQLVRDQPKVFAEANASGHLTNAANYLAIVGPANDEEAKERAGFYAERMVLTATLRGLGTLWVAGSWDKAEAAKHCRVTSGQELYLGVVIGHPKNHLDYQAESYEELCEAQRTHRATKTYGSSPPQSAMRGARPLRIGSSPASRLR